MDIYIFFKVCKNILFIVSRVLKIQIFKLMEKRIADHQFVKHQHQLKQIWVDFSIGF